MTVPLDPLKVAEHLASLGRTAAADLVRAMTEELALVRRERDALAGHARQIAGLPGHAMSHNAASSAPRWKRSTCCESPDAARAPATAGTGPSGA